MTHAHVTPPELPQADPEPAPNETPPIDDPKPEIDPPVGDPSPDERPNPQCLMEA